MISPQFEHLICQHFADPIVHLEAHILESLVGSNARVNNLFESLRFPRIDSFSDDVQCFDKVRFSKLTGLIELAFFGLSLLIDVDKGVDLLRVLGETLLNEEGEELHLHEIFAFDFGDDLVDVVEAVIFDEGLLEPGGLLAQLVSQFGCHCHRNRKSMQMSYNLFVRSNFGCKLLHLPVILIAVVKFVVFELRVLN